jgi:uncharacterized protein YgiM (DUF1202 family)
MAKFLLILAGALGLAGAVQAATMRVQVQTGQVRNAPSFLGAVVTAVSYGQPVEVVSSQGPWHQVKTADGRIGWMHESALTAKRVSMQSGGAVRTGASGDEMALAGKGFNRDVEAQFKAAHSDADFTWVDRMASMKASASEIERFVKAGGLALPGGSK